MNPQLLNSNITIIAYLGQIIIDGVNESCTIDLPGNIHQIRWEAGAGVIEYNDGTAHEEFTDFTPYESVIDAMTAELAQRASDDAAAQAAESAAYEASLTYSERRYREYPSTAEQLEALFDARNGDPTKLNAIDAQINSIKLKYPKV